MEPIKLASLPITTLVKTYNLRPSVTPLTEQVPSVYSVSTDTSFSSHSQEVKKLQLIDRKPFSREIIFIITRKNVITKLP